MTNRTLKLTWFFLGVVLLAASCKEKEIITVPEPLGHFQNQSGGTYFVLNATTTWKVPVGVTTVSDQARTVDVMISSPTGAVAGTHYTIAGLTGSTAKVTIPAGSATATIEVLGIQSQYSSGRKDSLIFKIGEAEGIAPAPYNNTYTLYMRGPCFDGDVNEATLKTLLGLYKNCFDEPGTPGVYGPYEMTVKSITPLTSKTARAVINNLWDYGFGDINFILDWTDPNNTIITVDGVAITNGDAGAIFGAAYAGMKVAVRSPTDKPGKFSVCNSKFNLYFNLGIYNPATSSILGFSGTLFNTSMDR